ncbi:hypothetical protein ACLQ25_21860 [Micromonospora sp. DT44]|uniref:hypothetical protein n=1 Tax=Micromonospora sp. DT44 TaxID=3393439 RepID=UPI003CF8DB50
MFVGDEVTGGGDDVDAGMKPLFRRRAQASRRQEHVVVAARDQDVGGHHPVLPRQGREQRQVGRRAEAVTSDEDDRHRARAGGEHGGTAPPVTVLDLHRKK